jgi:hypothetical protein
MRHSCFAHGHSNVAELEHLSRSTQHVSNCFWSTLVVTLFDSGGHLFARLAEPTMAKPGENFVFLHKKKNGAVFCQIQDCA